MTQVLIDRATLEQLVEALEAVLDDSKYANELTVTGGVYEGLQCKEALTAGRAALAQQGATKNCPQPEICGSKECEFCRDTAAPAPQPVHQGEWAELIRRLYAIANTEANEVADALNEAADMLQSAQPVAQPPKTCATCTHYKQGKNPYTGIYDSDCYECGEYYGSRWEAAHGITEKARGE